MKTSKKAFAILLSLLLVIGLAACGDSSSGGSSSSGGNSGASTGGDSSSSGGTYKISVNTALSGAGGGYGEASRRGAEIAIAEINGAGGVNGVMLEAIYDDNKMVPADAAAIAKRRFNEDIMATTVGVTGTTALTVMPLAKEAGIPILPIGLATPSITTEGNDYVYRIYINDSAAAACVTSYLVETMGLSKIAIVHDQNDYGVGGKDVIVKTLADKGIKPVAVESFKSGDVDFSSQLLKAKQGEADALIFWGMGGEMAMLASQSRELGMDAQIAGGGAMDNTEAYVKAAGGAAEGTVFSTWQADETAAYYQAFYKSFTEKYGSDPEGESILTYDAIKIIAKGLETSGNDRAALNAALKGTSYDGLYGHYAFNEKGDNTIPVSIVQWVGTSREMLEQIDPTPFY